MQEKPTILIAEDEDQLRDMYVDMLNGNHNVIAVSDGIEALEVLESRSVDLIISDYKMKQMHGLELAAKVRQQYPDLPFILISGTLPGEKAKQAGIEYFIQKPFRVAELFGTIGYLLSLKEYA